jgi:hypothetical protein
MHDIPDKIMEKQPEIFSKDMKYTFYDNRNKQKKAE